MSQKPSSERGHVNEETQLLSQMPDTSFSHYNYRYSFSLRSPQSPPTSEAIQSKAAFTVTSKALHRARQPRSLLAVTFQFPQLIQFRDLEHKEKSSVQPGHDSIRHPRGPGILRCINPVTQVTTCAFRCLKESTPRILCRVMLLQGKLLASTQREEKIPTKSN